MDDRVNSHAVGMGGRTYTLPAAIDTSGIGKRLDSHSLGFRTENRRPLSAVSVLQDPSHTYSLQSRLSDRKFSQPLVKPTALPPVGSRNGTPSPKRWSPPDKGVERTPTPEPVQVTSVEPSAPGNEKGSNLANGAAQTIKREPLLAPKPRVAALEVQSRITDIDREIAECQERLLMMGTTARKAGAAGSVASTVAVSEVKGAAQHEGHNDRMVPASGVGRDSMAPVVPQARSTKQSRQRQQQQQQRQQRPEPVPVNGLVVVTEAELSSDFDEDSLAGGAGGLSSDEGEVVLGDKESRKDKLRARAAVRRIYAENQARAASVQASLAAPFLAAFPRFVPGAYPEPSDWPFWAESERMHARTRPHLAALLGREQRQESKHARQLQEEYADLYARWRRRVDRLDRQREARQRMLSSAAATASGSGSLSGPGGRRRTAVAMAAADEFGFSLGPLFSASPAVVDASGRGDDAAFISDAVHSEAELQAIIERLQHDDARSPDARSQRTAATIPNMEVGARERALLRFANSSHAVEDPLAFYHAQLPVAGSGAYRRATFGNNGDGDHEWTQSEVSAFVAAYLTHPKEFGVIAGCVPLKSMNACVQFYYRNKKQLRLKALEAKANRRARRQAPAARRRKDRNRDRRDRRAREERERIAAEAAASLAAPAGQRGSDNDNDDDDDDDEDTTAASAVTAASTATPGWVSSQTPLSGDHSAGALERRSRGSALLRSIIQASRRRKHDEALTAAAPQRASAPPEDSEGSDGGNAGARAGGRTSPGVDSAEDASEV
ncbi:DNA-binding protein snt1, partial [Coemansia sp. RSA 2673]